MAHRISWIRLFLFFSISVGFSSELFGHALDQWQIRNTNSATAIVYANGLFVAVGPSGKILSSTNGANWTIQNSGVSLDLRGIAYGTPLLGSPMFVAVGDNGCILTSPNGISWTRSPATTNNMRLNSVAFGNGRFIAVASRTFSDASNVLLSFDGVNWDGKSFAPAFADPSSYCYGTPYVLRSIGFGNGTFVAVGDICSSIWTSTSGSTWSNRGNANQEYFSGVAYGNGMFMAVGAEGPIMTSTNGIQWDRRIQNTNEIQGDINFIGYGVGFGNGTFVIAREPRTSVLTTTNGVLWKSRTAPVEGVTTFAFGGGTFVGVGSKIVQSAPVSVPDFEPIRFSSGIAQLNFSGEIGRGYRLQISTNLVTWNDLLSYTNTQATMSFSESISDTRRFYRIISP